MKMWRWFEIFRRNKVEPVPLPEPPNPFTPEQTPAVYQFLDDLLVTTLIDVDANNDKQMDWCLAITGSIITAVIVAAVLHPASQHSPLLSGLARIFLSVLLLSTLFGVRAKVSMTGDKPDVVSRRSAELEKMLEPLRPKPPHKRRLADRAAGIPSVSFVPVRGKSLHQTATRQ
jgi:hypothetical protein